MKKYAIAYAVNDSLPLFTEEDLHNLTHPYVKPKTKKYSCKSGNPRLSIDLMVWDFDSVYYSLSVGIGLKNTNQWLAFPLAMLSVSFSNPKDSFC